MYFSPFPVLMASVFCENRASARLLDESAAQTLREVF